MSVLLPAPAEPQSANRSSSLRAWASSMPFGLEPLQVGRPVVIRAHRVRQSGKVDREGEDGPLAQLQELAIGLVDTRLRGAGA